MICYQGGILVTQLWSRKTLHTLWWCKWRSPSLYAKIQYACRGRCFAFRNAHVNFIKKNLNHDTHASGFKP
jgi:hypothetical protein